ncbi:hypothetical protein VTN77DRAFT_9153 [Rasamsonia byssochlamydoides]|uniref:uncharacterized protein n=1 Tax=Rasamsonia byssochlamydoides TaxID=89139 RepID=UPI003742B0EB
MSGFDCYLTHQYHPGDPKNPIESYASSSNGIIVDPMGEIPQNQNDMQFTYSLLDQNSQSRRASSMMFESAAPSDGGPYQVGPFPIQGVVSSMLFTPGVHLQMQQWQTSHGPYDVDGRFTGYDTTPFGPSVDPVTSFSYGAADDPSSGVGLPMDFDNGASSQMAAGHSQSLNLSFPTSYAPLLQGPIQGPNSHAGNLRPEDWLGGSFSFGMPVSGQTTQPAARGVERPLQNFLSLPTQGRRSESSRPPSYFTHSPLTTSETPASLGAPYIPTEISASCELKPAGKVASQHPNFYSSSRIDLFDILARVTTRPNPEIEIGAVDMSCAFILCDITVHDDPIIYVSDAFERLTGYTKHEILGRNCRFLQAPDGKVNAGAKRKYVDDQTVFRLKSKVKARSEVQVSMINYRKGGQSFMNLLTMIPIRWDSDEYKFYVGFQVDLVEKPQAVTKRNADGSYAINYQRDHLPRYVLHVPERRRAQVRFPQRISHDKVSAVLRSMGTGGPDAFKRYLGRVLLENCDDVIHILSLKGLFLYLSPSSWRILEYDASELVGKAISSVCHPSDIAPVTRELKQSTPGSPVSVVYRIRRKNSGYMWFESHGSLYIEPGKGRKCLILVGRERPVYALSRSVVLRAGGIGENDLWTKMSISGMFLFVSSNVRVLLDRHPDEMVGKSLQEFMRNESRGELGKALEVSRTGRRATFKHEVRHKRGHVLQAQTTLFPGDATPGSKPSFLVAQTRFLKSSRATYLPQRGDMAVAVGFATSTPASFQPQAKVSSTPLSSQTLDFVATEAGIYGLPLGNQDEALLSEDNLFEELKSTRGSSWQFELRQLERRNRLLAEELQGLLSRRKKRKRKKGTGPLEKACANCQTRNTPEWRRGPSGNRDLCNSCGLRWAKQNCRIPPRKNSDQSDKTSSPSSAKPSPGST